jgi:hypothetical protein
MLTETEALASSARRMWPMTRALLTLAVVVAVAAGALAQGGTPPAVTYPEGYRNWLHVKSMVIHDQSHPLFETFGGIHHVYVNPWGAQAARAGGTFPDGSVLVFDLLAARAMGGAMTEGARKFVGVMVKDSQAYKETGGWGFEAFKGDSRGERLVTDPRTQCFACHQGQQSRDYVFSTYRP